MAINGKLLSSALTATRVPKSPPPASKIAAENKRAPMDPKTAFMPFNLMSGTQPSR